MKHLQWRHKRAWVEQMASSLRLFAFNLLLNSAHQCGLRAKWGLQSAMYEFAVSPPKQQRKLCIKVLGFEFFLTWTQESLRFSIQQDYPENVAIVSLTSGKSVTSSGKPRARGFVRHRERDLPTFNRSQNAILQEVCENDGNLSIYFAAPKELVVMLLK